MWLISNRVVAGLFGCAVCCAVLLAAPVARAEVHMYNFTLSGLNEVPPNASPGTGDCTVVVDDVLRTLQVDCTYSGLDGASTAAHVYVGQPGQSGVVLQTLSHSAATSGVASVSTTMLPGQLSQIIGGSTFIRIHSAAFPTGEIRGQIVNPPPPQSLYIFGIEHTALGSATLTARDIDDDGYPQTLIIDNIGSSGNDGVELRLGPANGGIERPGVQGCFFTIQHVLVEPLLPIAPRDILKSYFETGDIPTQDDFIIDYDYLGEPGGVSLIHSPDLTVQSLHIELRHNGQLVDSNETPVPPAGALVTGPITEGEAIQYMTKAQVIDELATPFEKMLIVPIAMEKDLRFSSARMLSIMGGPPVLADEIQIVVVYEVVTSTGEVKVKFPWERVTSKANGKVHLHTEGIIHRDIACRALGDAQIVGSEVCDTGVCVDALIVDNLGSSGNDGVSFRTIKSRAGNLIPLDDRDDSKRISFLPITLAAGEELRIGSEWCPAPSSGGGDTQCTQLVYQIYSKIKRELVIEKERITGGFVSAGVTLGQASVHAQGVEIAAGPFKLDESDYVEVSPHNGVPVRIIEAIDADHARGEHVAGFVWKFADAVELQLPGQPPVVGDEVRLVSATPIVKQEGGRHTPFQNKAAIAGAKVEITEIQPAHVGFTSGHAFGLQHQAIGAAQLYMRDFSSIDNAPEEKERGITVSSGRAGGGGGCGSGGVCGVQIVIGQAEGIRLELEDLQLDGIAPECVGTVKSAAPGNRDVYVWKVKKGPSSNVELNTDFSAAGSTQQTISLYLNGGLVVSLPAQPNNTAMLTTGQPKIVENKKCLAISLGGNEDDGEIKFYWNQPTEVEVGGQLYSADVIVCRAEAPTNTDPLAFIDLTMNGELSEITLTDEAVQQFNGNHTGSGAAQLLVAADINQDGRPDLVLTNPSDGGLATMASQQVRRVVAAVERYHTEHDWDMIIPDPCAGLPPDCIPWPNEARYYWSQEVYGDDPFTTEHEVPVPFTVSCTFIENTAGGGHVEMEIDPSALGATIYHLQMYLNGNLVEDVPDYSGPLQISGDGGNNLNWPFGLNTSLGNVVLSFTTSFTNGRYVLRSGVPLLTGKPVLCDELRFIVTPANLMLTGLRESTLTTTDIETVYITGIQYDPEPICRADIAPPPGGDNTVGVPDLLAVINSWGPCPAPCAADLAPGNGDGAVGVPDLLFIINNWGPCPQ